MARDDERMRVRKRLGALEGAPRRPVRGGRWDLDEIDSWATDSGDREEPGQGGSELAAPGRRARGGAGFADSVFDRPERPGADPDRSDGSAVWGRQSRRERSGGQRLGSGAAGPAAFGRELTDRDGPEGADSVSIESERDYADSREPGYRDSRRQGSGGSAEAPPTPHWLSEPVGSVALWHERLVPERFRGTRLHPGRRGVLVLAGAGVVAVLVAAAAWQRDRPVAQPVPPLPAAQPAEATGGVPAPNTAAEVPTAPAPTSDAPMELVVSVVGLVEHVGLLHLPAGSRVADAVAAAVAREGADLARLNLAQRLADGDQVVVGALGPDTGPPQLGSAIIPGNQRPGSARTPGAATPSGPTAKVDLNTATESELDSLPGIGLATARNILAWRTEHGRFTSIDQLGEIPGIGPSRINRLRDLVTL